ncbi:MAG TPA: hypothetical protein VKA66_20675 [Mycobacterium sp.]|nr:hypothetical protein [Mycobacterium sp.]
MLTVVLLGVVSSPACAVEPWWHLTSNALPSFLPSGVSAPEVQDLTISGGEEGEEFVLAKLTPGEVAAKKFEHLAFFAIGENGLAPEASVIQLGLESSELYGEGNVEVIEHVPGAARLGLEPYVVKFIGALADEPTTVINTELDSPGLFPFKGSVAVTEVSKGRNSGIVHVKADNIGDAPAGACTKVTLGSGKYKDAGCTEKVTGTEEVEFELMPVPVTVTDTLPPGVQAVAVELAHEVGSSVSGTCSLAQVSCTVAGPLPVDQQIGMNVRVAVDSGSAFAQNVMSVTGGDAPPTSITRKLTFSSAPTPFGVEDYELLPEEEGGGLDAQAGSHPFQLTTQVTLNQTAQVSTPEEPKDLSLKIPPGLIANSTAMPRCTTGQFLTLVAEPSRSVNACPADTAIGFVSLRFNKVKLISGYLGEQNTLTEELPIFNLEPGVGEPARFGFYVPEGAAGVYVDTGIRTGEDYGATVTASNIPQTVAFLESTVTVWGVPSASVHNSQRGWDCLAESLGEPHFHSCVHEEELQPPAFLSMSTSCAGPLQTSVTGDSWTDSTPFAAVTPPEPMPAMDGCDRLPFSPSISVTPDSTATSSPSGLKVDVHVNQNGALNDEGLAQSAVKSITTTLPEGVAVNPSGGNGLLACSEGLVGFEGEREFSSVPNAKLLTFTPTLPGGTAALRAGDSEPLEQGVNFCPDASKVGTVRIKSPLLPVNQPLEGFVYLATQNENPFGSLIAMYIVAEDPVSGSVVKLPGEVSLSESGQLTATFKNTPQLAFEDAELHFFGGERAPLATPAHCGAYTTTASVVPWAAEEKTATSEGDEAAVTAHVSSTFNITSGPNGSACPGASLPFSPSLTGGSTNINAGGFSPLTTTIARQDGEQNLQSVTLHMPAGLEGLLSTVKLCPEAQANEGTCGPESLIGETTVSAGVGSDPVSVKGGKFYITEKYGGAPFGLSIVNPVKAGPFDLEHDTSPADPGYTPACDCVVVRARIEVNPATAELTVTTDESGSHAIPHLIDGMPVQIQKVNVLINRERFTFNPTSCDPSAITGAITSDGGATQLVRAPFQAANCALLAFKPIFKVSTFAKTSKTDGASLSVKLSYPNAPFGTQANIAKVKVDLPKQLPSRLTTLQKACLAAVFDANPAGCPAGSIVGHAKVITPVLPVPLEGPAYFVSHGGEAFPSLTIVLKGYGVTVDLVGSTFIKKGITSSTFKATPDVPFNTFELVLPQGKYSALAANGNLCKAKLAMPTAFTAQNGLTIHQTTPITVTNCPKAKKPAKHKRKH